MKNALLVTTSLLLLSMSSVYAAKPFTVEAKCPVQVIDSSIAPKNLPDYYFGKGIDKNKDKACAKAKKEATDKFPRGTKPKHCRCL